MEYTKANIFPEQKLKIPIPKNKNNSRNNFDNFERGRKLNINSLNNSRSNSNKIANKPSSEWRKGDKIHQPERPHLTYVDNIAMENNSFFNERENNGRINTPKYLNPNYDYDYDNDNAYNNFDNYPYENSYDGGNVYYNGNCNIFFI